MQNATNNAKWRYHLAKKVAEGYAEDSNTEVVMIAGSVGRGWDDEYSDIEIDVYYSSPPTEFSRAQAVKRVGGTLVSFGEDEVEWEEQMHFNGFPMATSTFLSSTMEDYLTLVVDQNQIDPLAQTRLSSLLSSTPVKGIDKIREWRARADHYPTELTIAMLNEYLNFSQIRNASMFVGRDDFLPLFRVFADIGENLIRSLLGLNKIYLPTPDRLKWVAKLIDELKLKPAELTRRLNGIFHSNPETGVKELQTLISETLDIVEANTTGFEVAALRQELDKKRRPWSQSPLQSHD